MRDNDKTLEDLVNEYYLGNVVTVFIAGPLVNGGHKAQWRNVAEAVRVGHRLQEEGFTPLIPHLSVLSDMVAPLAEERDWLKWSQSVLIRCADVLCLAGTDESPQGGTKDELLLAHKLEIPVFVNASDLLQHFQYSVQAEA